MRFLLVAAVWVALSTPCAGYDRASVLLSDHAVICSPGTSAETARHLVETWGALICVVQSQALWNNHELLPWVGVQLPAWQSPTSATDSLISWKQRLDLTAALVSDDLELARAATAAGLLVFTQADAFHQGAVAIPTGSGYRFYDGPKAVIFDRVGHLEEQLADTLHDRRSDGWFVLGSQLSAAFRAPATSADSRWQLLLDATHQADSLNGMSHADPRMHVYADRWRYCLAWWLSPVWKPDTLNLYAGQETEHAVGVHAGESAVLLTGIRVASDDIHVTWRTSWPVELSGDTTVELAGTFLSAHPGRSVWACDLECRFGSFRFSRPLAVPVDVESALRAEFIPPVLLAAGGHARSDPDFTINAASGQLELVNRSRSPLSLQLVWSAESPIELSAAATELSVAPGEKQRTGFTLNIPRDLKDREYEFRVNLSTPAGLQMALRGQLWIDTPRRTGTGVLAGVGCSHEWLAALPGLGVPTSELVPGSGAQAPLKTSDAVVIHRGAAACTLDERNAISEFAAAGGVVVVELDDAALAWLPWPVNTVRRPAPLVASFYNADLNWWHAPNELVGGCFAAGTRDSLLTLASGESGWEPLLVDDHGKGFMYRHPHGSGWYVLIHSGWMPRLEQLERRAHLGLFNLMSATTRGGR